MSHDKFYCLKCESANSGCKCTDHSQRFRYSHKLRVPTSTKNKVVFRKFLDECCIFVNCVPDELIPAFRQLLIKVKYYDKIINGHEWTLVKKTDKK